MVERRTRWLGTFLRALYTSQLTRERPQTQVQTIPSIAATARTSERGFYYVRCATRTNSECVAISASTASGAAGRLDVQLPRDPLALPDLVASAQSKLTFRVVDAGGAPIADATIGSGGDPRPPEQRRTNAEGVLVLVAPKLPAAFAASAPGWRTREMRFDGRATSFGTPVSSCDTRVEFVLAPVPFVRIRVLDRDTGCALFLGSGRAELLRDGQRVGFSQFQLDTKGEALVVLADDRSDSRDAQVGDVARVTVSARGYRACAPVEIDSRTAPLEPVEILLEPDTSTSMLLRGRVVRAGEPVAGLQIGLKVVRRSDGATPRGWQYDRVYSDSEGRFAARRNHKDADEAVTVFPHVVRFDEFGFIGPLSIADATAGEHVLELNPAARVPAILRGVSREGRYCYYVHVVDGELSVATTINGAPIQVDSDGEARVMLELPSDRRSRITIGFTTGNTVMPNGSEPVDFDPASPSTALVFELEPFFADLAGRVVGFTSDELARVCVAFAKTGADDEGRGARVADDGTFRLARVLRGDGVLFLLLDDSAAARATALARVPLNVQGDVLDLQLARDPDSLPEKLERQR
jgi:hypothetical protein